MAESEPKPAAHGPDYTFTYIETVIQTLSTRGLTITPLDVLDGLWKLHAAGVNGKDAETSRFVFLMRLDTDCGTRFTGWSDLAGILALDTNQDLFERFGSDAMRVAAIIRATHA